MFRKALSDNPGESPFINDSSKIRCPVCLRDFPAMKLVICGITSIRLDKGSISVGRKEICSSLVSEIQVQFHRIGCETYIIPQGVNGTYRWEKKKWCQLRHFTR
ncbi:MAG: hypothetical protein K8S87_06505 [Planctomycetes bacterium]|nr:hypothetical protein [Planctomycetota bacterium]